MGDNPQGILVSVPPAPATGAAVLPWASSLVRWLAREMPSFGHGFSSSYQPGRMIRSVRQNRLPWEVYYISPTSFGVKAGSLQLQDGDIRTTYDGYEETISATRYVYAEYNRGDIDGDFQPGWVAAGESGGTRYFVTGSTLPSTGIAYSNQYAIIHIATVNFSAGKITSIDQKIIGAVIPCPDIELPGSIKQFQVPYGTKIYGWQEVAGAADRSLVGASGTKAYGSTGGSATLPFQTTAVQSGYGTYVVTGQTGDSLNPYIAFPVYSHL